ncbi:MAG TPA: hypothetical protein VFJ76_03090 [Solirubrobacterales bacterium]|nr:hypothetical protein [Solirubrobacterales bacterium]
MMENDPTPINARPKRRPPEAFEDLSLALREHLLWPVEDRLLGLGDRGRAAVAGGAVVLALGLGIGGYSLLGSGSAEPAATSPVAAVSEPAPEPAPTAPAPEPEPKPEPTLHGAAPVFKPAEDAQKVGQSKGVESGDGSAAAPAASAANTGDPATDTITSSPAADSAAATTSSAARPADVPDGPPAGPAAIAVARKFADAFVVYETGGADEARETFKATATPELTKALMRRPPRQPAGVEVPQAKVLNIVPAPSHGTIYPLSISLLRVGATSELRLEMEQLKNQGWRVTNVLG